MWSSPALGPRKKSSLLDKFALYGNSWPNKWISRIQGQGGDRGDQGRADDPPKIGTPGWNKSETAGLSLSTLKNEGIQFVLPYDPAELPESKERYHLGKNSFRCAMNLFLAHLPISEVAAKAPKCRIDSITVAERQRGPPRGSGGRDLQLGWARNRASLNILTNSALQGGQCQREQIN